MFLQEEFGCSHFLLTNKVFSCLATSPSSWRPALPACSLLERRETSSQALSRWGTLVSRSSTNQGGPRPCPRKGHFWTCQIRMEQWKAFFSNLFKTFWAQLPWILLVALFVRLINQSPTASSWACCSPLQLASPRRTSHSGVWQRPGLVHASWSSLDLSIVDQVQLPRVKFDNPFPINCGQAD